MGVQSNLQFCQGISCTLGWIVIVVAAIIWYALPRPPNWPCLSTFRTVWKDPPANFSSHQYSKLAVWVFIISWKEFKFAKKFGGAHAKQTEVLESVEAGTHEHVHSMDDLLSQHKKDNRNMGYMQQAHGEVFGPRPYEGRSMV